MSHAALLEYSRRRGPEYDRLFAGSPYAWVEELVTDLQRALRGRRALELACGTGHWTAFAADVAESVVATDPAFEMRGLASAKLAGRPNVEVRGGDAYRLDEIDGEFDCVLAIWLSHVPRLRLARFLEEVAARVGSGSTVFLADNRRHGETDAYERPGSPDTFELRETADGSRHEIVKNYFEADELVALVEPWGSDLELRVSDWWWWLTSTVQ